MNIVDKIFELFLEEGGSLYFGEQVTEAEHALQCAYLAEQYGASPEIVAAALLHDLGHLLHDHGEDAADNGVDGKHEDIGALWLQDYFPPVVVDCVRLHVDAKRYLTATQPGYFDHLSPSSKQSLALQGGPFNAEEVTAFEQNEPNYEAALLVRGWDDEAKVVGLQVPTFEHYRNILTSILI